MESVSREIDEIRLSLSHQRTRETMQFHQWITKKITCAITGTRDLWTDENRKCFVNDIVYSIKFNVFQKIGKIFHVLSYEVLFFRFFDSWYIIKYLLTETSGKQYVLYTALDCRCFPRLRLGKHRQSRVHKTYCFPRSQSKSVNYYIQSVELAMRCSLKAHFDLPFLHFSKTCLN